jgi:hypothetical protein
MNNIRYNKSKTYLLPLLSENISLDKRFYKYIENTYIFDDLGLYKNCIFIEHDYKNTQLNITRYENNLMDNVFFKDIIQIDERKKIFVFNFPKLFMHEYKMFKQGKYSLYQRDAKHIIIDFYTEIYSGNINAVEFLVKLKQVLFKDKKLKKQIETRLKVILDYDAELTDIMDENNETCKLKELIEETEKKTFYSDGSE